MRVGHASLQRERLKHPPIHHRSMLPQQGYDLRFIRAFLGIGLKLFSSGNLATTNAAPWLLFGDAQKHGSRESRSDHSLISQYLHFCEFGWHMVDH
ncbi:MAG: hypothetical protein JW395_1090 [Nitrospira sp.]|nr:hypothetical protein [Nitrospira sp.]